MELGDPPRDMAETGRDVGDDSGGESSRSGKHASWEMVKCLVGVLGRQLVPMGLTWVTEM